MLEPLPTLTTVPFVDLAPAHDDLKGALLEGFEEILESGEFVLGPHVEAFEREFAVFCGTRSCVGVSSGLDALRLILLAAGVGERDEVIVPAATFAATLEAVCQVGARPVVVDVGPLDYTLEPDAVEGAITRRTRAVLPVHLYGQMADLRTLVDLAHRFELIVVEDACQAHGARRHGIRAGSGGAAAAFSFYPAKNLGAMGDAGGVVTNDLALAERVRSLRVHGETAKYHHELVGYTARMDAFQALVLATKLPLLAGWNRERAAAAGFYTEALADVGDLRLPAVAEGSEPVWHLYVVRTADPGGLAAFLAERGIGTGRHYPEPPHLARAYAHLGYARGAFPVAEALSAEGLSLPLYPGIREDQLTAVVGAVEEFFAEAKR